MLEVHTVEDLKYVVRKIRAETGLSQAEFASCIGYTQQVVSQWENGIGIPSVYAIFELASLSLNPILFIPFTISPCK